MTPISNPLLLLEPLSAEGNCDTSLTCSLCPRSHSVGKLYLKLVLGPWALLSYETRVGTLGGRARSRDPYRPEPTTATGELGPEGFLPLESVVWACWGLISWQFQRTPSGRVHPGRVSQSKPIGFRHAARGCPETRLDHVFACLLWLVGLQRQWRHGECPSSGLPGVPPRHCRYLMKSGSQECSPSSKPPSWDWR
jgi:hypothetical protein